MIEASHSSPLANPWLDGCVQSGPRVIIKLSLWEMQRWLWKLLFPKAWPLEQVLHWSYWRRVHQAVARFDHYRKRSQALTE